MSNIAFLFPGQGAQYVGMGREIAEYNSKAKEVFDIADKALGFSISKLCFEGPETELIKTENTQPAILTASIAILKAIQDIGLEADVTAGLSLGEYTALVYAGAMNFEEAVTIVKKRGRYMQEAVPFGKGTMAAIIGLDRKSLEEVLEKASDLGIVEGANYNSPQQIVIAGEVPAVEKACELAREKGAKRAVVLPVSAPFHSSMLKLAGVKLEHELKNTFINDFKIKVISNVTGKYIESKNDIINLLTKQVHKPVLWQESIELMLEEGIDTFIEIGPGKTLTGFTKKIAKELKKDISCFNVENVRDLEDLKEKMD